MIAKIPRLPPNCPYFDESKIFGPIFYYENPTSANASFWVISRVDSWQRKIIQTVAQVAWIKEAKRLSKAVPIDACAHNQAVDRADEWRDWSGGSGS